MKEVRIQITSDTELATVKKNLKWSHYDCHTRILKCELSDSVKEFPGMGLKEDVLNKTK